MMKYTNKK